MRLTGFSEGVLASFIDGSFVKTCLTYVNTILETKEDDGYICVIVLSCYQIFDLCINFFH